MEVTPRGKMLIAYKMIEIIKIIPQITIVLINTPLFKEFDAGTLVAISTPYMRTDAKDVLICAFSGFLREPRKSFLQRFF
jgi:hypothetical protein